MTVEEKLELLNLFKQEYGLEDYSIGRGGTNYGISPYWTSGNPYSPNYELSAMETHELMTMDAIALLCERIFYYERCNGGSCYHFVYCKSLCIAGSRYYGYRFGLRGSFLQSRNGEKFFAGFVNCSV